MPIHLKRILAFLGLGVVLFWVGARLFRPGMNSWTMANGDVPVSRVVCFGDSLVSGEGAESTELTYPRQLGALLGQPVATYGYAGATAESGLGVVAGLEISSGVLVIVTLGGNDLLRRVPWDETAAHLGEIFRFLQDGGALVAFTGVEGPVGNYAARHRDLCQRHGVILIPDILAGIHNNARLKADPIHPNGDGYAIMAQRVSAAVGPYLGR